MSNNQQREYPNSGILFRDDKKDDAKDRDYRGDASLDCPECQSRFQVWVSGWIKQGKRGKFLSLSFRLKEPRVSATDGENVQF